MNSVRRVLASVAAGILAVGSGVLPLAGIGAAPARAAEPADPVTSAQAAAGQAARQVQALLVRYQVANRRAAAGAAALATSFTASASAEAASDAAAEQLARSRRLQAQRVRGLYAAGGSFGLAASLLGSPDPEQALWAASTARQLFGQTIVGGNRDISSSAERARSAAVLAEQADTADRVRVRALDALQEQQAAAADALAQARATLRALSARARQLRAAQLAAAQIAAAQAAAAAAAAAQGGALGPVAALPIPPEFEKDYRSAATSCPGMSWTLLAGVGQVESGHGRNNGPSSAGAIGPMQFMPGTFALYAVDGDHNGVLDAWDPEDAIWTAAHYLCVSGAAGGTAAGIHQALFTYNHAEWYVALVLRAQQAIITAHPAD